MGGYKNDPPALFAERPNLFRFRFSHGESALVMLHNRGFAVSLVGINLVAFCAVLLPLDFASCSASHKRL